MPIIDGISATKTIRRLLKDNYHLPIEAQPSIIGVTGHVLDSFQKEGLHAGMDQILSKPLYFEVLKSVLIDHHLINY